MAKFKETYCSQCGVGFGAGDNGFSHCWQHRPANLASNIESTAIYAAGLNGRDWIDCGEYERESYRDEARRSFGIDPR